MDSTDIDPKKTERAIAWYHSSHAAICDVHEPWAYGTVVKATKYPDYFDYNVVRVEDDPGISGSELAAVADEALDGYRHRRLDFDSFDVAAKVRGELEADGWNGFALVWMLHEAPPPDVGPEIEVEFVPYDDVHELRLAWHQEESPDIDPGNYHREAREVALLRNAQLLTTRDEAGNPVAFAQLEQDGNRAEITQVFVHPNHRGGGRGTAMSRAAIAAAGERGDIDELWICADADGRPKDLYHRLGFRTAASTVELLKIPG